MAINFLSKIIGKGVDHGSEDLASSIQAHLVHLLNVRQGKTEHLEGYGLPDIHEIYYNLPGSLNQLAERIKETVRRYEPRLSHVEVSLVSEANLSSLEEFRATYRISGEVVEGSRVSRLSFQTELERDGRAHTQLVTQYG